MEHARKRDPNMTHLTFTKKVQVWGRIVRVSPQVPDAKKTIIYERKKREKKKKRKYDKKEEGKEGAAR
jgi:hypothetical protein